MATPTPLLPIVRQYVEKDPLTAAHHLETMDDGEASAVLEALPPSLAARVMPYLQVSRAAALVAATDPGRFTRIADHLDPRQVATILLDLPKEARQRYLAPLPDATKHALRELLTYPENSAGRILSTDFLAFHTEVSVRDAIQKIRALGRGGVTPSYAYVLDAKDRLAGVLNMRDLLLAEGSATLGSVMRKEVFAVNAFTDREEIANQLADRNYFAVPVVDAEQRLLGTVKTDQLLEDVQEEATEDLQKMVGAGGDERSFSPIRFSMQKRLPWLHVNLATAFLAASVVAIFEQVIARITILAVFLPVVAGQGGNAGAQSLAVVMRGLVMREIPGDKAWPLIWKETLLGLANGVIIGLVTGVVVWWWNGNPFLGVVICLAMIVNLLAAGLFGAAIPLGMKAMGRDPAQSSSILLTTVTDVVGFFAFLGFAVLFYHRLV